MSSYTSQSPEILNLTQHKGTKIHGFSHLTPETTRFLPFYWLLHILFPHCIFIATHFFWFYSCSRRQPAGDHDWSLQAHLADRGPDGALQRPGPQLPQSHPRRQHQLRGVRAPEDTPGSHVALTLTLSLTSKLECDKWTPNAPPLLLPPPLSPMAHAMLGNPKELLAPLRVR